MANPQFDFVPYPEQAQRLQKSAIEEAQRARTHTLTLPPAFWVVEPGDVGEWTSVRNGYSSKQFRVDAAVDKANLDVSLSLTEVDPSDYDWDRTTDLQPVTGGTTVSSPPPAQGVTSWNVQPYTLVDDTGVGRRPAILISWDGGQPGISGLQFEVRLASNSSIVTRGRSDRPTAGNLIITQSLLPATAYQVRGQYIPSSPRDMAWSGWTAVTTPDVRYSLAEFDAAVKAQVTTVQDALQDQLNFALQQIAAISANQDARNWSDKKEVRSQLAARSAAAFAAISDVQTVAVNTQTALASYQGTVTAQFATVNASITTNASAIATLNGYAAAAWSVALDVNGSIAGIQLVNGGSGTSSFVVTADKFQIKLPGYSGGAPVSVFTTGTIGGVASIGISGNVFLDGTLNASKIVAGSITTNQIAVGGVDLPNIIAGAVSNTQVFATSATGHVVATTTVCSQVVNIQSGKATIRYCGQWSSPDLDYAGNRPKNGVNIVVDGTVVKQFVWTMLFQSLANHFDLDAPINVEWTVTGLSAGNHTFAIQVTGVSGGGFLDCTAGQMYVTDFRR
ncbi:DUF1983 domain-containing protein [Bradyrhizobium jicamae]|uniref:phage tail protein n=1 Tax=Bradyrhizobium jicamae TaxID=280332 RepID=UPI001BA69F40|nr:DUF1983 domain-containing protein [Bradyrhizobium jicamae]MBR0755625.1 DUF1983 domain-containing protein [Bradyrhizobium jicamae]